MRVVLYDDETMEPLTAITLPIWMHERLRAGQSIHVPFIEPLRLMGDDPNGPISSPPPRMFATIWFEEFHRKGQRHWFCFTRDSENAMKLKSVFLPGQWSEVHKRERDAFNNGVLEALDRMLR